MMFDLRKTNFSSPVQMLTGILLIITLQYELVSSLGTCGAGELRCQSSGHCIPKIQVCDGVRDCDDGLDENDLICSPKYRRSLCGASVVKKVGVFQCQYGGCIPISRVCDGNINCLDGSDESEHICGGNSCLPGQFRCKYGACIPDYKLCDGRIHCPDGSDETTDVCRKRRCGPNQFMCKYGGCIPERKICDNWKNCADGSDEVPELCLITRARMQVMYDRAQELSESVRNGRDDGDQFVFESYQPIKSMLSLTRRPTLAPYPASGSDTTTRTTTPSPRYEIVGSEYPPDPELDSFDPSTTSSAGAVGTNTQPGVTLEDPDNATHFTLSSPSTAASSLSGSDIDAPISFPSSNNNRTGMPVIVGLDNIKRNLQKLASARNCTLPKIPRNAVATITTCRSNPDAEYCRRNTTSVPYGAQVTFECSPGYLLNGPISVACTQSGIWTSPPPTCEPILDVRYGLGGLIPRDFQARCAPLTPTRGVHIECIDPKNLEIKSCHEPQKVGVEARYTCSPYYRPAGDLPTHYEKCDKDGQWSPGVQNQFSCVPDCGVSEGAKTAYILNGQTSVRGQWPWHVGIYIWVGTELTYICGGSLITEQTILTSAHCVTTASGYLRNVSSFVVYLGKQNRELPDADPFIQKRLISSIFVEETFNFQALDSDIAIIAMDKPAVLSYYVRPACYPQTSNSFLEEYQLAQGNKGTVVGWGLTENGTLSTSLRMTELPVVSPSECTESHPDFFGSQTRSTTFCAGYRNGTNVCNGDSGGGIYFRATVQGVTRWYIQGLVSYGVPEEGSEGNNRKCSSSHYAVFTRVGRYGDWIVRTLSREHLI